MRHHVAQQSCPARRGKAWPRRSGRDSGPTHRRCRHHGPHLPDWGTRMLSYPAPAAKRSGAGRMPSELVGVGRFELPASSSRTKRAAKLRYTPHARDLSGTERDLDSLAETQTRSGRAAADRCHGRGQVTGNPSAPGSAGWPRDGRRAGPGRSATCPARPRRAARPVRRPDGGAAHGPARARSRNW